MTDVYVLWGLITCGLILVAYLLSELAAWVDRRRPLSRKERRHLRTVQRGKAAMKTMEWR